MKAAIRFVCCGTLLLVGFSSFVHADQYLVNRRAQWLEWEFPGKETTASTLDISFSGAVSLRKYALNINAALDATKFSREDVAGGVNNVGSNRATARNIFDGNPETYWQPAADAPLEDWWIELDLGRVVPVTGVKVTFPDTTGARPFQEFRVFGSNGIQTTPGKDIFVFELIGGTTTRQFESEIEYEIRSAGFEATVISGTPSPDDPLTTPYQMLKFIGLWADAKNDDAALAEIEVFTFGENVALGTLERRGSIVEGTSLGPRIADGDFNTSWGSLVKFSDEASGGESGFAENTALEWDLGALFWVDQIIIAPSVSSIQNFRLAGSDGRLKPSGELDFQPLFDFGHADGTIDGQSLPAVPGQLTIGVGRNQVRYRFIPPRPIRHLDALFRGTIDGQLRTGNIREVVIVPAGHPAQVRMVSGFIDLGQIAGDSRAKVIQSLNWETDPLPNGAWIEARTRTGNDLAEVATYYNRAGQEVTKKDWEKSPKQLRGEVETYIDIDPESWSSWSKLYLESGQEFLSPSPRRYAQIELRVGTNRPDATPALLSVSIDYTDAFLNGVTGELAPRTAPQGVEQTFSYSIRPSFRAGDSGFDRILLVTPAPVDMDSLLVRVGGRDETPADLSVVGDSLIIQLAQANSRSLVDLTFNTTVTENPSVFSVAVGNTDQPQLWQPVDPSERYANTVFVPTAASAGSAINNLVIEHSLITPNGDGFADATSIRFNALKADREPLVQLFDLSGRLVRDLSGESVADQVWTEGWVYEWTGTDRSGNVVVPGIYLCRVEIKSPSGDDAQARLINVAY